VAHRRPRPWGEDSAGVGLRLVLVVDDLWSSAAVFVVVLELVDLVTP